MSEFSEFIIRHENDDTDRLLLNREKFPGIDIPLAVNTIICRKKLKAKVPSFYAEPSLIYPRKLSVEQCSSEESARYKVELIQRLCLPLPDTGGRLHIADLTGGLGVDSAAFAAVAEKVLYNEMNPELAEAARHNFTALGLDNITVCNTMLVPAGSRPAQPDGENGISTPDGLLSGFRPDIIFLDPARRAEDGKKVFMLEDCQPDILALKDELLQLSRFVMVKLSPMADIDMAVNRLGPHCRIMETVSVKGECKELLAVLDREYSGECTIVANCSGNRFSFTRREEAEAQLKARCSQSARQDTEAPCKAGILMEPDKALMKAAPFNLLCERFGLVQLDSSTHYFIAGPEFPETLLQSPSGEYGKEENQSAENNMGSINGLFKTFEIIKAAQLDKHSIKEFSTEFPKAEVTARNIPLSSDLLRKKLGTSPSDEFHIFGLKVSAQYQAWLPRKGAADCTGKDTRKASSSSANWLFACRRLPV